MADTRLLDSALSYAGRSWPVFPCHTPRDGLCSCNSPSCARKGKYPRTRHGFKDATIDEARIRRDWQGSPHANIGIATGEASGIIVLDVDGDAGEESIAHLQEDQNRESTGSVHEDAGTIGSADAERPEMDIR